MPVRGGADDSLRALKGDLCNALWPTFAGCLYGRSASASHVKARYDAQLDALLTHFGPDRLLALAIEVHTRMTSEMGRPPRTFLGHMDRLHELMLQEEQAAPPDPALADATDRFTQARAQSEADWALAIQRFDALPLADRDRLLADARHSNPILASRPADSPTIRAAAIALLDQASPLCPSPAGRRDGGEAKPEAHP